MSYQLMSVRVRGGVYVEGVPELGTASCGTWGKCAFREPTCGRIQDDKGASNAAQLFSTHFGLLRSKSHSSRRSRVPRPQ